MSSDVLRSPCRGRGRGRVRVIVRGGRGALLLLLQVVACLCFVFVALAKSSKSKSTDKHFSPVPLRFKLDDGSVHTFSGGSGSSSSSSDAVPSGQTKTVKLRDGTKLTYTAGGNKRSTGESILTISADSMRMSLHDHRQSAARNPASQVNRDSFPSGFALNDPSTTERNARTPEEEARLQHVTYHYGKKEANKILEEKAKIRQIVEGHHRKHDPGRFVHGDADVHF